MIRVGSPADGTPRDALAPPPGESAISATRFAPSSRCWTGGLPPRAEQRVARADCGPGGKPARCRDFLRAFGIPPLPTVRERASARRRRSVRPRLLPQASLAGLSRVLGCAHVLP